MAARAHVGPAARRIATLALALPAATLLLAGPAPAQPQNAVTAPGQVLAAGAPGQPPIEDLANFPRTTLEIVSGVRRHRFDVWIADTDARKEQGLMFVRDLPENQGMLFPDCCMGIWMKNTYIELDIVFVGKDGRIAKIAPRARPFDETTIPAPGPAEAVVELEGGEAERLGLRVGDRVTWKAPVSPSRSTG
ncbi:MAG: DUF192 domain-containing protein [Steroidobacteraceae bacterium]